MLETFEFTTEYGVLKKNIFGKYIDKVKEVINVKTKIVFDDVCITVTLYGIDRNDYTGIHNEENVYFYDTIQQLELLEDVKALNIIIKDETALIDIGEKIEYDSLDNNYIFIDDASFERMEEVLCSLQKFGFLGMKEEDVEIEHINKKSIF